MKNKLHQAFDKVLDWHERNKKWFDLIGLSGLLLWMLSITIHVCFM